MVCCPITLLASSFLGWQAVDHEADLNLFPPQWKIPWTENHVFLSRVVGILGEQPSLTHSNSFTYWLESNPQGHLPPIVFFSRKKTPPKLTWISHEKKVGWNNFSFLLGCFFFGEKNSCVCFAERVVVFVCLFASPESKPPTRIISFLGDPNLPFGKLASERGVLSMTPICPRSMFYFSFLLPLVMPRFLVGF